jgi:hypothetical protein
MHGDAGTRNGACRLEGAQGSVETVSYYFVSLYVEVVDLCCVEWLLWCFKFPVGHNPFTFIFSLLHI